MKTFQRSSLDKLSTALRFSQRLSQRQAVTLKPLNASKILVASAQVQSKW